MKFLPKNEKFYNLFEAQTDKLVEAAELLKELREEPSEIKKIAIKMKKLEEEADDLGHQIISSLHQTFITPIEREDIDILRQNLDDIMDEIERAVNRMAIYKISFSPFPKEIMEYLKIIEKAIREIKEGAKEIRDINKHFQDLRDRCERINQLENQGDDINRKILEELMTPSKITPQENLEIMKKKEIYESLENAIDKCEDVANVLESILIKNM